MCHVNGLKIEANRVRQKTKIKRNWSWKKRNKTSTKKEAEEENLERVGRGEGGERKEKKRKRGSKAVNQYLHSRAWAVEVDVSESQEARLQPDRSLLLLQHRSAGEVAVKTRRSWLELVTRLRAATCHARRQSAGGHGRVALEQAAELAVNRLTPFAPSPDLKKAKIKHS